MKIALELIALLSILISVPRSAQAVTGHDELSLTEDDKKLFEQFKQFAVPLIKLDIYKKDVNLIKFFKAVEMDLGKAKALLRESLKLRKEYKLDGILEEDWAYWKSEFPYEVGVNVDKENRPIVFTEAKKWTVCKHIQSIADITRYWLLHWEEGARAALKRHDDGFNVSRMFIISDLHGFDTLSVLNPDCTNFYNDVIPLIDKIWPRIFHKLFYINSPPTLTIFEKMVKPYMTEESQANFMVFGENPAQWKPILLKSIKTEQLPKNIHISAY